MPDDAHESHNEQFQNASKILRQIEDDISQGEVIWKRSFRDWR